MDPNSNWNVDAGQITPSSHTRLNDMNDLFDPQELWNSMGDWLYDPHNFENQYEGYTPAAHHPSMHHDVNVLDLSELPQLSEMADTANAATVADADTFDRLKRWLDVDTANIDSSPGIDSSAIGQCWDRPNATDPNVDLGMHPMPPGDCSHQHFQTVDPNLVFPPNQASTSRDILTSNGVNAPICPSDCNAWNRHLASNAISEVGTLDFAMRAMHDYTITDHLAQANQYHTHLSRSRPAEERSFSNEPNTACFGASHMPISKKRRHRIPESVRNLLEQHFTTNAYPTPTQIDALALSTNQEPFRIRNWFSNARARRQAPDVTDEVPRTKVREKLSQESLEKLSLESFPKQQPPLDAYLASSITDEPAQLSQIEAALASTDNLDPVDQGSRRRQLGKLFTHQYRSKHLQRRDPQSVASSRSSVATASTISSLSSYRSDMSSASRGRRRGRKRFAASTKPSDVDAPKHGFYCTFCWKSFKNKYEWKRHESTVHIPHHSWVCCLSRSPVVGSCPFCGIPNPSFAHIESHDYLTCLEKPEESRTFYRKDQFFKHIINTHCRGRPEDDNGAMEPTEPASEQWLQLLSAAWYKKMPPLRDDDPNLHCGFCGLWFHEWSHRCEHIAEHYAKTQGIKGSYGKLDWWPERKPAFTTTGRYPGQCLVCANSLASPSSHFLRTAWSCSFLRSHLSILEDYAPGLQRCMLCHWIMEAEDAEFHHETHRHRGCKQEIFHSCEHMIEHLNDFHNAKLDNDQFWCFGESVRIRYSGYICAADPGFAEIEAKAVLP